ncbi:hypothetical protein WA026_021868 [Henosepilachna vigintioctopunctata]|uniref:Uncharacterized protein n=1 Tax=Henosepilachna vigintioctopunctata TaxID=420089 RepID=A0AAW1UFY8_9CUCU
MRRFVPSVHCNTELHRAGCQTTPCPSTWPQERSDGRTSTTPASAASFSCANFNCEDICTQFPLQYRFPTQLIDRWPFIHFVSSVSDSQRLLQDDCRKSTSYLWSTGIECTSLQPNAVQLFRRTDG